MPHDARLYSDEPVPSPPPHQGPPLLRLGVIQNGRLVEERVLRNHGRVTIGWSPRNALIIPSDRLPDRWTLFRPHRGGFSLHLRAGMDARLAIADRILAVSAPAAERGIELPSRARGRINLGDTILLFQLLPAAAPRPRPQLPRSLRKTWWQAKDGVFLGFALGSFLLHLTMVIYLRSVDWPRQVDIETVPDRFLRWSVKPKPPAPAPVAKAPQAPAAPARNRATPSSKPARTTPPPSTVPSADERRASLQAQVQRTGLVAVIGALSQTEGSSLVDLLRNGSVDRAQEDALRGLTGVSVASSDTTLRGITPQAGGTARITAVSDLRGGAGISDSARVGPAAERRVPSVVRPEAPTVDDGGHPGALDQAAIAREVRARLGGVRACYESALKHNPTLAGKLVLRFVIAAVGTVASVDVDDDTLGDAQVTSCLRAMVARWRFPAPGTGSIEVAFPFVFQPGA